MSRPGMTSKGRDQIVFPPPGAARVLRVGINTLRHAIFATVAVVVGTQLHNAYHAVSVADAASYWAAVKGQSVALPVGVLLYAALAVVAIAALYYQLRLRKAVYLLDFECFRPDDSLKVDRHTFLKGSSGFFDAEAMAFQERILDKAALSEETFVPPGLLMEGGPQQSMQLAREEAEMVIFNAVQGVLKKTGIAARQVDILVVNCSLFNPTPSLSAMVINHFKMRSDVESYNLGGMGCSAGIISVGLARRLLNERGRGGYALVVSTENMTQNWYKGSDRSMLIPNTIFRMGSAAIMLTNKPSERRRAKYELEHLVRVHLGADDAAYKCVFQHADADGNIGVELNRDLVKVASKSMEVNLTRLGPLVLPWSEKLMFAANWVARKLLQQQVKPYIPDFKQAFDHFCLHVGGRGVVEGLSKQLGLNNTQMSPSANTLYWYGNTSSSTVWYSFGYLESVQGIKKGDIVWQIGFGSGFKCNSAVWRALRPIKQQHKAWEHIVGREDEAMETLKKVGASRQDANANEHGSANGHGTANGNGAANGVTNGIAKGAARRSTRQNGTKH